MRIPLGELEEARRDPRAYVLRRRASGGQSVGFRSKYLTLKRAVYRFHRSNDLTAAQDYLEESYLRQFKRPEQLTIYARQLERYAEEFVRSGAAIFRIRDRLIVPLPQKLVDAGVRVAGEIPRVDLTSDGYTAWLFAKKTEQWEDELRLPIIQAAYAREMGAGEDEVKVGVYDFSKGSQKIYSFSPRELRATQNELLKLLKRVVEGDSDVAPRL